MNGRVGFAWAVRWVPSLTASSSIHLNVSRHYPSIFGFIFLAMFVTANLIMRTRLPGRRHRSDNLPHSSVIQILKNMPFNVLVLGLVTVPRPLIIVTWFHEDNAWLYGVYFSLVSPFPIQHYFWWLQSRSVLHSALRCPSWGISQFGVLSGRLIYNQSLNTDRMSRQTDCRAKCCFSVWQGPFRHLSRSLWSF